MYYLKENSIQLISLSKYTYRPKVDYLEYDLVLERGSIEVYKMTLEDKSLVESRYEFEINTTDLEIGQYHLKLIIGTGEVVENYLIQIGEYTREESSTATSEVERIGF